MLKNFFKIALRHGSKNKLSAVVNIAGLAVGMTLAILICLWITDELSYNHYHKRHKQLAVILSVETVNAVTTAAPWASVPMAAALKTAFPAGFKNMALTAATTELLKFGDKKISQSGLWAQPDFPDMFTLKMVKGNLRSLENPAAILLSQSAATTLFADKDPINQVIQLSDTSNMKVAGVYEDIPSNSSFHNIQFLLPWDNKNNAGKILYDDWNDHHFQLFVQLNDGVSIKSFPAALKDITKPHLKGAWEELQLHPMDKWLLYDKFENGRMVAGRMQFVWLFGIIGIFVLLLACINYMNLSTARSEKRAREVGIRKVLGSGRRQLARQFLAESLMVTVVAIAAAIVLAQVFLPYFNVLAGKQISIPFHQPLAWLVIIGFTFVTGLLSGSYPALYLSGFKPAHVLKGTFAKAGGSAFARRALVVFQFTVSITLISGAILVLRQLQYAKNRPVGYTRDGLLTVNMNTAALKRNFDVVRHALMTSGAVENVAASSSPSTGVENSMMGYDWEGRDPHLVPIIGTLFIDQEFGKTIGWRIIEGRDFSKDFPADSGAYVLNEAAAKFTGLKQPVVGKSIRWHGKDHPIVGVIKDMVMESPYHAVEPVFFTLSPNRRIHVITIRINPAVSVRQALAVIGSVFKKFNPESPFDYHFTDDVYKDKFNAEEQIGLLANVFAVLAIFISCLGLFGLSSFVAEQRTREIGVRKILGASVFGIWKLITREFVLLILVSMLIATPIALFFMHQWLQDYPYRTPLSWWIFLVTGLAAVLITVLTVSYHAIRAAVANPVKSLRST